MPKKTNKRNSKAGGKLRTVTVRSEIFLAIGVMILLLFSVYAYIFPWQVQYYIAYARCGHQPVIAIGHVYTEPGSDLYRPLMGANYYCDATAAQQAGYRPVTGSSGAAMSNAEWEAKLDAATKFDPAKIDYQVYVPDTSLVTYTTPKFGYGQGIDHQVFYEIRINGKKVADIHQGDINRPTDRGYQVCVSDKVECAVIGHDGAGREISKVVAQVGGKPWIVYGMTIDNTFITIAGYSKPDVTPEIAVQIYNSLKKYP